METIRDPFTRNCSSYKNGEHIRKDFYYDTMIDCDRIYYKLNDQKEDYVATAVVKKIVFSYLIFSLKINRKEQKI